jgi:hypothetical protein
VLAWINIWTVHNLPPFYPAAQTVGKELSIHKPDTAKQVLALAQQLSRIEDQINTALAAELTAGDAEELYDNGGLSIA